ncbi:hypothetical protein EB093_04985 [bacterium]|nr:hypothetical protein [bacterium]
MLTVAIATTAPTDIQIQCLGSRVMEWNPHTWLIDLDPFLGYWKRVAMSRQQKIMTIWKQRIAEHVFGFMPSQMTTPLELEQLNVQAVWDYSPLRAVMMMSHMKHSQLYGWITPNTHRHTELWQAVTWDTWESVIRELVHYWSRSPLRLDVSKTMKAAHRLQITSQRLGMTPSQLSRLPIDGLHRRYGPWMARVCQWLSPADHQFSVDHFPWSTWQSRPLIQIRRRLDAPTHIWDHCTQELIDDLDSIGQQCPAAIVQMDWHIQLETDDVIDLPIRFRAPHIISSEIGHHTAIRLQLSHAYRQWIESHEAPHATRLSIAGWTIIITATINPTIERPTLFDWTDDAEHERNLRTIVNHVTTPLHRFHWAPRWTPEESFSNTPDATPTGDVMIATLPYSALTRPLFVTTGPQPYIPSRDYRVSEFVMAPWWKDASHFPERRYSIAQDSNRRWVWISQTPYGTEIHGIYA